MKIENTRNNSLIGNEIRMADTFFSRFKGLIFTRNLPEGSGLLIRPCDSVHMMFMLYPIDVVFMDDQGKVIRCFEKLRPYVDCVWPVKGAKQALELPAGNIAEKDIREGDLLKII